MQTHTHTHKHDHTHAATHNTHTHTLNLIFLPALAITPGLPVFLRGPERFLPSAAVSQSRVRLLAPLGETL